MSSTKKLANDDSVTARLPNEVLGSIFARAAHVSAHIGVWRHLAPKQRFNFSFVCQRWRAVSIATPCIWPAIDVNKHCPPDWVHAMVERSKTSNLTVQAQVSIDVPKVFSALRFLLKDHLWRIAQLDLELLLRGTEAQDFWDSFAGEAPNLKLLRVDGGILMTRHLNLPGKLRAATLLHLDVKYCEVAWQLPLFRNLQHLKMSHSHSPPSCDEFVNTLQCMQDLTSLDLEDIPDLSSFVDSRRIKLTNLQRLYLRCHPTSLSKLLQHLELPSDVAMSFECSSWTQRVEQGRELFFELVASLNILYRSMAHSDQKVYYHELQQIRHSDEEVNFRAWKKPRSPGTSERKDDTSFTLDIYWMLPADIAIEGIAALEPMSQLTILTLSQSADITPDVFATTFGSHPTLKMLSVDYDSWAGSLDALILPSSTSNAGAAFANLEIILLYNLDFGSVEPITKKDASERIKDCLTRRQELGVPIKKVHLFECYSIKDADIMALRDVAEVERDKDADRLDTRDLAFFHGFWTPDSI